MLIYRARPYELHRIVWPYGADQGLNAVILSEKLQVGYELVEVRSGLGLKPIYRTGRAPVATVEAIRSEANEVLSKAFGEDGEKKRAKLAELSKLVRGEWEDGGASLRDVTHFLETL